MKKSKSVTHKVDQAPRRREFIEFAGLGALGLTLSELSFARVRAGELLVYVGTYTTGKSEGIYLYRLNDFAKKCAAMPSDVRKAFGLPASAPF